jgi:hypothetical protein
MAFEVVGDELQAHASHLDGLMDRLRVVRSAAATVSMSHDAYGLLCSFLPPIINPLERTGGEALEAASGALGATAASVRSSAAAYAADDEASARPFGELGSELPSPRETAGEEAAHVER